MKVKHLSIMFTDIKGFTSKTARKSRQELHRMLELHDALIKPIFKEFGGKVIKTIGDAFLVTFTSPTEAVLCGMKMLQGTHPCDYLRRYIRWSYLYSIKTST